MVKHFEDNNFFDQYLDSYITRYTDNSIDTYASYLNNKIDYSNIDLLRKQALESNKAAFDYLFSENIDILYPHHIQNVAGYINKYSGFSRGYRKTEVAIFRDVDFEPVPAPSIPMKMICLFDNYHNIMDDTNYFKKEASFHLQMVRIQPFEDSNKRIVQLITSYNLIKNGYFPIIIKLEDQDKYLGYISNNNTLGMASLIKEIVKKETKYVDELYNSYKIKRIR